MKWIVFAVLVALLCGETAYIFVQRTTNGSGISWQKLPAPPQRADHIAHLDGDQVVVEAEDQKYYSCSFVNASACWQPIAPKQFEGNGYAELWQPSSEQAPPPLPAITEIKYVVDNSPADYAILVAAAIQNDGTVQSWRTGSDLYSQLLYLVSPLCAGTVGLFASLILALLVRLWPKKRKVATRAPRSQPRPPAREGAGS